MTNDFSYDRRRHHFPLKIVSQIDVIDEDDLRSIEKTLDLPDGAFDTSDVSQHIHQKYGFKILLVHEDVPDPSEPDNA